MGLVGQGLVGHPVIQGRTPAKVFQVGALPIERQFLPCLALWPISVPLVQAAGIIWVVLHISHLVFSIQWGVSVFLTRLDLQ